MSQVGPIERQVHQELAEDSFDPQCSAVSSRQAPQALDGLRQTLSLGQEQGVADGLINLLTHGSTTQGVTHSAARSLQLEQQMEVTELQDPPMLMGDFLDSRQIVGNDRSNTLAGMGRDSFYRLVASVKRLLGREAAADQGRWLDDLDRALAQPSTGPTVFPRTRTTIHRSAAPAAHVGCAADWAEKPIGAAPGETDTDTLVAQQQRDRKRVVQACSP